MPYYYLMKLHLVLNEKSGRGTAGSLTSVAQEICAKHGAELVLHPISEPSQIVQIAAKAVDAALKDSGIVAVAGGDGSVRALAQNARGKNVRVAVIPSGTFNLFARTNDIPLEQAEALELALTGVAVPVQIADFNGEAFVLNASLGLYAKAISERKEHTKKFGRHRIVAIYSTLKTLLKPHSTLHIDIAIDGQKQALKTSTVFIGNNSLQLRDLNLDVSKCISAGKLAVVIVRKVSAFDMIKLIFRGIAKTLQNSEHLETDCADSLMIHLKKPSIKVALDGEMFHLNTPLKIQAQPKTLLLMKTKSSSVSSG